MCAMKAITWKAINKITKLVGDLNIFVFSDDIDLARKLLKKI